MNAVRLLAIDQGSKAVGFAYFERDDPTPHSTDLIRPRGDVPWIERMQYIDEQLRRAARTRAWMPDVIAIEDVVVWKGVKSALTMGQNRGWLMRTMWELFPRARHMDINPSSTKGAAMARMTRDASKVDIAHAVETMTGLRDLSEDECDAVAIAWAAYGKLREQRFASYVDNNLPEQTALTRAK